MPLAFVLLTAESGMEGRVLKSMRDLEKRSGAYVREAFVVYGLYDIVTSVEADSMELLNSFISEMRQVSSVKGTLTMIVAEGA